MDALLPLGLVVIMTSLGISLETNDFRRVFKQPSAIAIGLVAQIIGLPLIAFLLLTLFGIRGEMAVGVMLISACPGGVSAGLLTLLAGGETALSISLTALTSLGVLVTLPITVGFALEHFASSEAMIHMPIMRTGGGVFLLTILPVIAGMSFRQYKPQLATAIEKMVGRVATLVFIGIVVVTFVQQREVILQHLGTLGPMLFALNVLAMVMGAAMARVGGLHAKGQIALAMECGLHNAALGILVANTLLQVPTLAAPSVVYAFLMNLTAIALVVRQRRKGVGLR